MNTNEFLKDLAERLMRVPVSYGVDGGDIDRLARLAREIEEGTLYAVHYSAGVAPAPEFNFHARDLALARWEKENSVPSYIRPGTTRKAQLIKRIALSFDVTPGRRHDHEEA